MLEKKKGISLLSFLALWAVEILKNAAENQFDFANFFSWFWTGLGSAIAQGIIGMVVGGFVLFNIFLFFYNIFKPDNNLSFSINDKITAGLWLMIIIGLYNFIRKII